jgi:hypothetical protein
VAAFDAATADALGLARIVPTEHRQLAALNSPSP